MVPLFEQQQNGRLEVEVQRSLKNEHVQSQQIAIYQNEEKQREQELECLREEVQRLMLQQLDESKYRQWNPIEIAAWIVNVDKDRLKKYQGALQSALKKEGANGSVLEEVDGGDLMEWGIRDRGDRKFVQKHIEELVKGNNAQKGGPKVATVAANEGAPTAYM